MDNSKIKKYLFYAFGLAWVMQILASVLAVRGSLTAYSIVLSISMFAPFLAVLAAKLPLSDMGFKPHFRGNWKWIFFAWFGMSLLGVLGAALYFLCFPDRLDLTGKYLLANGGEAMLSEILASGISLPLFVAIQAASSTLYAPWINMFFALGEEAGWRGTLNPYLKERFGRIRGLIFGGIIWGIWHWPIMLLSGYEYGKVYWGAPVLGMALFCLIATAMGIVLDFLYEKSRTIWIPALAHGAINAFAGVPVLLLDPAFIDKMTLGPTMVGLIGGLPMIILAAILLLRKKKAAAE